MPHIHIVAFEFSRKVIQYWSPPGRPSTGHHKCATAGPLGPCFTDGYRMGCLHATAADSLDRWRWRDREIASKKKTLRVWQPKHFPDHQNHQKMSLDSLWWFYQTISFQMFHHWRRPSTRLLSTPWEHGFPEWLLKIEIHHCNSYNLNIYNIYIYIHSI